MIWAEENQFMLNWYDQLLAKVWAEHKRDPSDLESQRIVHQEVLACLKTGGVRDTFGTYRDNPMLGVVVCDLLVTIHGPSVNRIVLRDALEERLSQSTP